MKLLDRYIFKKFFFTFLVALIIFALLIILIHAANFESSFKQHHLTFYEVCNYYCCALPDMVNTVVPISAFATVVWVTARLRSEMIALLSGGISLHRIIRPYLIIALLLTGAHFYFTGWLLPNVDKARIELKTKYFNFGGPFGAPVHLSNPLDSPTRYFQTLDIAQYDVDNHTGYDILLRADENSTDIVEELRAKKMQWDPTTQTWILQHWQKKTFCPEDEHARWPRHHKELTEGDSLALSLKVDAADLSINPSLKELLTLPELYAHIQKLTYKGSKIVGFFIGEKQIRYMIPFATMMHILLGFLVAIGKPKIGKSKSGVGRRIRRIIKRIILGFILACLYIFLFALATITTETESLLMTWMPNIIFFILCTIFYRLAPK